MPDHVVPSAILWLPFLASVVVFVLRGRGRNVATWLMTGTALACLLFTALLYPAIAGGDALRHVFAWAPSLGLDFTLRVDGFSWLFRQLICGNGMLVGV
jgi:multicomponent K+:H+ antiporter subunit A